MARLSSMLIASLAAFALNTKPVRGAEFDEATCCPLLLRNNRRDRCEKEALDGFYACVGELTDCAIDDYEQLSDRQKESANLYEFTKCVQPRVAGDGCKINAETRGKVNHPCMPTIDYRVWCDTNRRITECQQRSKQQRRACYSESSSESASSEEDDPETLAACEVAKCEQECACRSAVAELCNECLPKSLREELSPEKLLRHQERNDRRIKTPEECKAECAHASNRRR